MTKRSFVAPLLWLALAGAPLWAGDVASFVDLGFSADGTRYMFAQYGVDSVGLKPWAELYVVDVPKNNFVPGGKLAYVHDAAVVAGQDGSGAFYKLLAENAALPAAQKVDFLRQAQPLFLSLEDGVPGPAAAATIDFRDFDVGAAYSATLVPYFEGTGATLKSSFYIAVERKAADGTVKKYTVGTPALKRPLVSAYRIRRALVAPKDGSLIFVVELWKQGATGPDLRYMVEALRL